MKTLSIKQPYATLIAEGIKDIENRSFKTHFRGTFLIHASGQWHDRLKKGQLFTQEQITNVSQCCLSQNPELNPIRYLNKETINLQNNLPVSAIIGQVDLVDCVINHPSIWAEKTPFVISGNQRFYPNKPIYNWVLENAILYPEPFLNVKGKLSFWDFNI